MKKLKISKEDLLYNLSLIKSKVGEETKIIAVVKANAMGLGLIEFSKFLIENGIEYLAVANYEEALILREAEIQQEIMLLSEVYDKNEIANLLDNNIILTIGNLEEKEIIENIACEKGIKARVQVKIDTGFGRYGFVYFNEIEILNAVQNTENIEIIGVFTHFSKAINKKITYIQFNRFVKFIPKIKEINENLIFHASNSTATFLYPDMNLDAVRIGSAFQGRILVKNNGLKKIGKFMSNIVTIKNLPKGYNISYSNCFKLKKDTLVAVVPVGYIDGFNLRNQRDNFTFKDNITSVLMEIKKVFTIPKLTVKINEKKYNVIGRLGMYHAIIDITKGENIKVGDEVYFNISPMYINASIERSFE